MTTTEIRVTITTSQGFDTQYLFPGLVPHVVGAASSANNLFDYRTVTDAQPAPHFPVKLGTHYGIDFFPFIPLSDLNSHTDLSGFLYGWSVDDQFDSSHARLGTVGIGGWVNSHIFVASFNAVTPDSMVSSVLSRGEDVKLYLTGAGGKDTLRGSFWDDELDGKGGADTMIGGDGSDHYFIDNKGDKVVELAHQGYDTLFTKFTTTLAATIEAAQATGRGDIDFTGNSSGNQLSGNAGDNVLKGMGGGDILAGGDGHDTLYGGDGGDFFEFVTPPSSSNWDTIKDFDSGHDKLVVSQFVHIGLTTWPGIITPVPPYSPLPAAAFFASNSGRAHDADDRIIYDRDDGKLFFDPNGSGAGGAVQIALLTGHPTLKYTDILIL